MLKSPLLMDWVMTSSLREDQRLFQKLSAWELELGNKTLRCVRITTFFLAWRRFWEFLQSCSTFLSLIFFGTTSLHLVSIYLTFLCSIGFCLQKNSWSLSSQVKGNGTWVLEPLLSSLHSKMPVPGPHIRIISLHFTPLTSFLCQLSCITQLNTNKIERGVVYLKCLHISWCCRLSRSYSIFLFVFHSILLHDIFWTHHVSTFAHRVPMVCVWHPFVCARPWVVVDH